MRHDRLVRELEQLAAEYQAVAERVASTLNPADQVRLERQLEQLESRMEAIEADLNP